MLITPTQCAGPSQAQQWACEAASAWRVELEQAPAASSVTFQVFSPRGFCAGGTLDTGGVAPVWRLREHDRGGELEVTLQTAQGRATWRWRWTQTDTPDTLEILERSTLGQGDFSLDFSGSRLHCHSQLAVVTSALGEPGGSPSASSVCRLGAFTQHGQLLDLRDWCLADDGGVCAGILAIRPGQWSCPEHNLLHVQAMNGRLRVRLPLKAQRPVRRSYLLAHVPVETALEQGLPGHYAVWPAQRIARRGFARSERLISYRHQAMSAATAPPRFAFGARQDLDAAIDHARRWRVLGESSPLWRQDYAAAAQWMFDALRQAHDALISGGYLHPDGNPVACRSLSAAATVFHILDLLGRLSDREREEAVVLLCTLAELLYRRDFYPHHIAMIPEHAHGHVQGIYRGMLNQNFNTDRYAFVGVAGCILPDHPHARRWRTHAVEQFRQQMQSFVYPGGCWEESHSYAEHVKLSLMPLVLALRHCPEPLDLFADPRFEEMCRFFVPLLSPPDPINGMRSIPAIGDHGLDRGKPAYISFLYGWMAKLSPSPLDRARFAWAWKETGYGATDPRHPQIHVFSPLMIGNPETTPEPIGITLPELLELPGYGAAARLEPFGTNESLLVVRCGQSWAHYHHDQGSFWWWRNQRLICADADLGNGALKHHHLGHNVPGYPGRQPMQFLDRPAYRVDRTAVHPDRTVEIRCQLPVEAWEVGHQQAAPIPSDQRPHIQRTFLWHPDGSLEIIDEPRQSPEGCVTWTVHVVARNARRTGPRELVFDLDDHEALHVNLAAEPVQIDLERHGATWRATAQYREQPLLHRLRVQPLFGGGSKPTP